MRRKMDLQNNVINESAHNLKCINFTVHTAQSVLAIKMSLSSFAIVVNLAVIFTIFYTKKTQDFMYRLVLYLMVTDVLQAFAIILISLPVTVPNDTAPAEVRSGKSWSDACVGSGFISMVTLWMGNLIIFWIVLYLVWLGWSLYRRVYRKRKSTETAKRISAHASQQASINKFKEIGGVIFLFVAPIAIAIIPLFAHGNMYGLSGLWCWIKVHNEDCGDLGSIPLVFELMFFYAPLVVIVLLVIIFIMATFICYCRGEVRRHEKIKELKQRHIKEIMIVLAYPLLYCSVCLLLLINRIHSTVHQSDESSPFVALWITHSVADPVRIALPALAFLINPYVWKDACNCACTHKDSSEKQSDKRNLMRGDHSEPNYGTYNVDQEEYESALVNSQLV